MLSRMSIKVTIAVVILLGIGGYTFYEFRNLLLGPVIVIETPASGIKVNTPVTNIIGHVKNISKISMNDRDITVDAQGEFQEKFVLSQGNNIIKLAGVDRFGRKNEVFVEVSYSGTQSNPVAVR